MANPDLSALSSNFVTFGGKIFSKNVNDFDAAMPGIMVYKNVTKPIALPKLSAVGHPVPYASADNTSGNGVAFTDRVLTVNQSKWDMDIDPEQFRNTYLSDGTEVPFYQFILDQVSKEYLASINDNAAYLGVYDAAGTDASDMATGWGTLIAAAVTAGALVPVTTAAHSITNAVGNAELVAEGCPVWMKKKGFKVYCSYGFLEKYKKDYRTRYGFNFQPTQEGKYMLDGMKAELVPASWLGTSSRLIATVDNNLVMGTNTGDVSFPTSVRRNILELRALMPIGFQISDFGAMIVNDLA
jgi:hypothetical protein